MNDTFWRELNTPEGKKYYYNVRTKESQWLMPLEIKDIRKNIVCLLSFA